MDDCLTGAIAMSWVVAGLFFVRFWRETKDRLFLIFAVSFWILALSRLLLVVIPSPEAQDEHTYIYWLRLAAYVVIIVAIIDKNLHAKRSA